MITFALPQAGTVPHQGPIVSLVRNSVDAQTDKQLLWYYKMLLGRHSQVLPLGKLWGSTTRNQLEMEKGWGLQLWIVEDHVSACSQAQCSSRDPSLTAEPSQQATLIRELDLIWFPCQWTIPGIKH